uniref:influenza virus NS1A-binding protein homolog n=1 Tax=Ciona intestinalis TaxID=7719 RepID=UPI000EF450A4|nr:influenza virus NS1A-binding protein homolog [Ciona intestinalis]|eukprot:XP_026692969.1 influenza virus NS1A-binding protein homolog [Ciona intestinalis]
MFEKQKQRKQCYPCKDIIFVPNGQQNIACFNVSEQEWSSLKVKGVYHNYAMFIVHDEMVYCFGYINENSFNFGSNISKRFNGIEWENLAPMINCHYEAAVASIQGRIFVFGGLLIEAQSNVACATNRISKYNPTNNTWTDVGHTKTLLSKAAAVGVGNVAYICGGHEQANGGQRNLCASYIKVNRRPRKKETDAYSRGGYEHAMAVQRNLPTGSLVSNIPM